MWICLTCHVPAHFSSNIDSKMPRQLCDPAHMCHRMHRAWKQHVVISKFGSKYMYASIVENYLLAVKLIRIADCKAYIGTV